VASEASERIEHLGELEIVSGHTAAQFNRLVSNGSAAS
jgi:hypothetical protein